MGPVKRRPKSSSRQKQVQPTARPIKRTGKSSPARVTAQPDEQFKLMIDAVVDYAIYMLDPKGRVITWNPGASRLKGYSEREVLGKDFALFFTEDARQTNKPRKELETAKLKGRFEEEGWRVRKNGHRFWANVILTPIYDATGSLRGFVKVTRDLTERKEAEEKLRESEQWLSTTLRSIGDGVIATDAAGDVKFLNPVAQSLTGWTEEEARKLPLDRVFVIRNEHTRQPVASPFFKVISTGGVVGLANHTVLIARDGTERPIADSGAPILDAAGQIQGVVLVFRENRPDT